MSAARRRAAIIGLIGGIGIGLAGCAFGPAPSVEERALRYVALGDSYTIGTSVREEERWPNQLVARLGDEPPTLELVANLGVNGYTSSDLLVEELAELSELSPEFVTVLIGVNDVVQGFTLADYEATTTFILDQLVDGLGPDRVLCIATPDYTVTPVGAAGTYGDPAEQRAAIQRVNAAMQGICEARGVRYLGDIFTISGAAADDRTLVASDGLHPSGAQYSRWVDAILPVVEELLGR